MDYLSSADQKALNARYRSTALVVAALAASVLIYLLIGWLLTPPASSNSLDLGKAFYLASLILGLAVVALRRLLLSPIRLRRAAAQGLSAVLSSLGTASIIGAALGEAVGILGLLAYLLIGEFEYNWRLGVIGLLLIIYSFPRRGEWVRAASAATTESGR
jgi:hypothetical protein